MVSAIWNAASEGDLEQVKQLLSAEKEQQQTSGIDVEIKDHTGSTPLIEAVRKGHIEVVKELLQSGCANPYNGRPESYTSDETILGILTDARASWVASSVPASPPPVDNVQTGETAPYAVDGQYPPPHGYYRPMMPTSGEGAPYPAYYVPDGAYYVPPPPPLQGEYGPPHPIGSYHGQNMPPPEVTKSIPCRYFPACRYGASCAFAHPHPTPYYSGIPSQYPAYDPKGPAPYPPPFFQAPTYPPVPPHVQQQSSHPQDTSSSPPSTSPQQDGQFTPPPPAGPFMIPPPYYLAGPFPPPPLSHVTPYTPTSPTQSTHYRQDSNGGYQYGPYPPVPAPAPNAQMPPSPSHVDTDFRKSETNGFHSNQNGQPRENSFGGYRRGRPSFSSSGPRRTSLPCMFYPSGKCRNGDNCRFQHIEDDTAGNSRPAYPFVRGYKGRTQVNGSHSEEKRSNDFEVKYFSGHHPDKATIAEQLASLPSNMRHLSLANGYHGKNSSNSGKSANVSAKSHPPPQRIPNADDFPSLNGSSTVTRSPASSVHSLLNGKTAAQILKSAPQKIPPKPKEVPVDVASKVEGSSVASSEKDGGMNGPGSRSPSPRVAKAPDALEVLPVVA